MFCWLGRIIHRLAAHQFLNYAQQVNEQVLLLAPTNDVSIKIATAIPLDQLAAGMTRLN